MTMVPKLFSAELYVLMSDICIFDIKIMYSIHVNVAKLSCFKLEF